MQAHEHLPTLTYQNTENVARVPIALEAVNRPQKTAALQGLRGDQNTAPHDGDPARSVAVRAVAGTGAHALPSAAVGRGADRKGRRRAGPGDAGVVRSQGRPEPPPARGGGVRHRFPVTGRLHAGRRGGAGEDHRGGHRDRSAGQRGPAADSGAGPGDLAGPVASRAQREVRPRLGGDRRSNRASDGELLRSASAGRHRFAPVRRGPGRVGLADRVGSGGDRRGPPPAQRPQAGQQDGARAQGGPGQSPAAPAHRHSPAERSQ